MSSTFWLYHAITWIEVLIVAVALGYCMSWTQRRGKDLLVVSLTLLLTMLLTFQILNLLYLTHVIAFPRQVVNIIRMAARVAGIASYAFLLAYAVVVKGVVAADSNHTKTTGELPGTMQAVESMTIGRALFSFQGRMARRDYWLKGFPVLFPIGVFNNMLVYGVDEDWARVVAILIGIAAAWPAFALIVKRLHDRNRSGWFAATILIPFANIIFGIWITIEVWFLRGTVGPNRFGQDPVQ